MFVFTSFLRKGQCSGENVTAIHLKKKFPLSETSQEFQIRLGDIRKQLKSNLKSPPTFHLLFLPSNYCSWSMYWQIFPKWAIICLKTENFLVKMKLFSLKNEFIVTLQKKKKKKPKCSDFPRNPRGWNFTQKFFLDKDIVGGFWSWGTFQGRFLDTAAPQGGSKCALPLFSTFIDGSTSLPGLIKRIKVWPWQINQMSH